MVNSEQTTEVKGDTETQKSEWELTNPLHLERSLRENLREINLVGELDLNPESELYLQAQSVLERVFRNGQELAHYPASVVVYLVSEGIYRYRGGAYWDQLSLSPALQVNQVAKLGPSFLTSLEALSLETFASVQLEENALRFVMPILLHGGIPRHSAADLWKLLLVELNAGLDEADQMLAKWNGSRWSSGSLDKPVQRFFRHGGSFAVDLLQRMIDLIEYVSEIGLDRSFDEGISTLAEYAGLPAYLPDTLLQIGQIHETRGPRLPRPQVTLDPYSGEGPAMILPPYSGANQSERWFLRWGSSTESLPTSRVEGREHPLEPADHWNVALGSSGREWSRGGVEGLRVFFFDSRTRGLLIDQRRIRAGSVIALAHRSCEFLHLDSEGSIPIVEELPEATGPWSGWVPHLLDLSQLRGFRIRDNSQDGATCAISISALGEQPSLLEMPLQGVSDDLGRTIFSSLPTLVVDTSAISATSWNVRFRFDSGSTAESNLHDLTLTDEGYKLNSLLGNFETQVAGELFVRGPLGSDFRTRFVVIEGLRLTAIEEVIHPDKEISITASAPGATLNGEKYSTILHFPAKKDVLPLMISTAVGEVELLVTIPRVLWFIRTSDGIRRSFDSQTEALSLRDLERGIIDALLVRARRQAIVQLHLIIDGKPYQSSNFHDTAGTDGQWTFSLREFATSAALSGKSKLDFRLDIDSIELIPLSIFMEHQVSEISVESVVDKDEGFTLCQIHWRENRNFEDRCVWFWSQSRPWSEPYRHDIDNSASGSTEIFVAHASLPPGPYLLEIGLHDPWIERSRPSLRASNVAKVAIGNPSDVNPHLKSLDKDEPLQCLELVVAQRQNGAALRAFGPLLSTISHQIGAVLASIIDERGEAVSAHPVARELFQIICSFPEVLLSSLEDIDRLGTSEDVTRFMIVMLPEILNSEISEFPSEIHERLWRISMLAGAGTDLTFGITPEANDRWERYAGWSPAMRLEDDDEGAHFSTGLHMLPFLGTSIDRQLSVLPREQLEQIIDDVELHLKIDEMLILQSGAFQQAGLHLLKSISVDQVELVNIWRSRYGRLNDLRARCNNLVELALDAIGHIDGAPAWTNFLQELLASAVHLMTVPNSRPVATMALTDALAISPNLVTRNLLIAMLFTHWSEESQ